MAELDPNGVLPERIYSRLELLAAPTHDWLSGLALGPYGWVMTAAFVVAGLLPPSGLLKGIITIFF